jgi:hypothetical protein
MRCRRRYNRDLPKLACGDEVYGSCTQVRESFEARGQAYVLRVPSNFSLTLAAGTKMTCAQAVTALLKHKRRWEVRSAGSGSKGERWYAWAWIATASPRHHLLVRRHLRTGELAFHYCWVPDGQILTKARLIRATGLRWQIEEDFTFSKTASASTSARPGSTPRSPATPCWSWLPWPSAPSPPPWPGTAPIPRLRPGPARPAATTGTRHDPADHPRDQAAARRPHHPAHAPAACHPLGRMGSPPPGPLTMVRQTRQARPRRGDCPGQLAKCGCLY